MLNFSCIIWRLKRCCLFIYFNFFSFVSKNIKLIINLHLFIWVLLSLRKFILCFFGLVIIISLIPSQNFNKFIFFMVKYWWWWFALLTLIILLGKFENYFKNVWNSFFLFWSLAQQYFWYVLFLLLIDVNIPFVNHGSRFTLHSFKDNFFNGGIFINDRLNGAEKGFKWFVTGIAM